MNFKLAFYSVTVAMYIVALSYIGRCTDTPRPKGEVHERTINALQLMRAELFCTPNGKPTNYQCVVKILRLMVSPRFAGDPYAP
jgi:hypothetical protein